MSETQEKICGNNEKSEFSIKCGPPEYLEPQDIFINLNFLKHTCTCSKCESQFSWLKKHVHAIDNIEED